MDRDTCAVCETTFDGNTPRTTPGCELCGTCESCGCQINLDTMDTEAAIQRATMRVSEGAEYSAALRQLTLQLAGRLLRLAQQHADHLAPR